MRRLIRSRPRCGRTNLGVPRPTWRSYASSVPVSRKRKKTRTSKASARNSKASTRPIKPTIRSDSDDQSQDELTKALTGLVTYRRHVDARKAALATSAADALVAELVAFTPSQPDSELEDDLCRRLGARLGEFEDEPIDDHVDPDRLAGAVVTAAAAAVRSALDATLETLTTEPDCEPGCEPDGEEPDGWRAPWRVLTTMARILPFPLSATTANAIGDLRDHPGGHVLPTTPGGPTMTGQVLWTRDAYGSRFGVTTAFTTLNGPDRWYLWDIDACGFQAFTVHSAYYATAEQALAAWQVGVGVLAAGETTLTAVDDPWLLADLLPAEEGLFRAGGENAGQPAEYHRSRRLAETAIKSFGVRQAAPHTDLDDAGAAAEFTAWLRAHRADQPQPAELEELITELVDSWHIDGPAALYGTCSPHRIALTVLHLRNYYQDDFAAQLVALLPEWACWLAERNRTASELAERCRPYALGETHPDVGSDDSRPDYRARVTE